MSLSWLHEHYIRKYKLSKQRRQAIFSIDDDSFDGMTYSFPTFYDIHFLQASSTRVADKAIPFLFHSLFIALIVVDFIYTNIHSQSLILSLSSSITALRTLSISCFVCSLLFHGVGAMCKCKQQTNRKALLSIASFCTQTTVFALLLFGVVSVFFLISPPLLLYLCLLAFIKTNTIRDVVDALELHDVLNMKHMQIDYNFIPYNFVQIDSVCTALYRYLFAYILIRYESLPHAKRQHRDAVTLCLEKCQSLLAADALDTDMDALDLGGIPFSRAISKQEFITQTYMYAHMIKDVWLMAMIVVLAISAFWVCYAATDAYGVSTNNLWNFYAISYAIYVFVFVAFVCFHIYRMERVIRKHMGWLTPLYLADYVDINTMHYVKFMHCLLDIVSYAQTMNAIRCALRDTRISNTVIEYVYNVRYEPQQSWLLSVIERHYGYDYGAHQTQQLTSSLQFDARHWLTLKLKILAADGLQVGANDDEVYVKLKMRKPKFVNYKTKHRSYVRSSNDVVYYGHNSDVRCSETVEIKQLQRINQEFSFNLKFADISMTTFVVSIIAPQANEGFDNLIAVAFIKLKEIFSEHVINLNGHHGENNALTTSFDVCGDENEKNGCIHVRLEMTPFDALFHIKTYNESTYSLNNSIIDDDDTVPLISLRASCD